MRSLIWALDPLRATPEGGVTVLCENEADRSRLAAQMDLLEPEHRPELLTGNLDALPRATPSIGSEDGSPQPTFKGRTGRRCWRQSTNMPSPQRAYGC